MSTAQHPSPVQGPIVFAYDGSELAKLAIDQAAAQVTPGRAALVLTVWHPFDVGFVPAGDVHFDAAQISDVKQAAEHTAADGASRAQAAGFDAGSAVAEAAPTWKGIVNAADEHDASLIVLGSHGRNGFAGALIGSVAEAVVAHSRRSVLVIHRGDSEAA
ncbi:MAG TPA: universal stress protein [Solirubrobacteraceae bacterium]|nr:universal stress protein [Solirubrobacteraceae bacterium]